MNVKWKQLMVEDVKYHILNAPVCIFNTLGIRATKSDPLPTLADCGIATA